MEVRFLGDLAAENMVLEPVHPADPLRMAELVARYHDLPLGTVDASVIAAAEGIGSQRLRWYEWPPRVNGENLRPAGNRSSQRRSVRLRRDPGRVYDVIYLLEDLGLKEVRVQPYLAFAPLPAALGWRLPDMLARVEHGPLERAAGLLLLGTGIKPGDRSAAFPVAMYLATPYLKGTLTGPGSGL